MHGQWNILQIMGGSSATDEVLITDARKSFVTFEPLGVIASIMPWNFPYWQALRFGSSFIDGREHNSIETSKRYYAMWN